MTPYEIVSVCFGAISIICAIISSICAIVSIRKEKKVKEHLQTIINIKKEIQITSSKFNIKDSMNETTSNVFEGWQGVCISISRTERIEKENVGLLSLR